MKDLPWVCRSCGGLNMVNFERLVRWPVSKVIFAEGFICKHCHGRVIVFHTTTLLNDAINKLNGHNPLSNTFQYHFAKIVKNARRINRDRTDAEIN